MRDFNRLKVRFCQFGGWRLVREYARMGVLWIGVKEIVRCAAKGRSMKAVYPVVTRRVDEVLVRRYETVCDLRNERCSTKRSSTYETDKVLRNADATKNIEDYEKKEGERTKVWWCWLQGEENAPVLAKACLDSLRKNLRECEIIVITAKNWREWVKMPEYIVDKYEKGKIPHVLFSDLLRLELLIEHGGVWIDSTVMCTERAVPDEALTLRSEQGSTKRSATYETDGVLRSGDATKRSKYIPRWEEIVGAELFVFQYTQPGQQWTGNISNWFISAKKDCEFLKVLRDMLFAYWKDYDCVVQYYIFHLFFAEVAKQFPDVISNMPYGWSEPCLELGRHLGDKFDEAHWTRFSQKVVWHKMSYRVDSTIINNEENYYNCLTKR